MDSSAGSLRVLSHYDETNEGAATSSCLPTRGVSWVLGWAAAIATLVSSTAVLAEFVYCLAGEQALARAARAGALEATLPEATLRSIEETVKRRLERWEISTADLGLSLDQNGVPVRGKIMARDGDRFEVSLVANQRALLPAWLRAIALPWDNSTIAVRAERRMPGAGLD